MVDSDSTVYKVTIVINEKGPDSDGSWFAAYVHTKSHDPTVKTCSRLWGCKNTGGVKLIPQGNPDELVRDEYPSSIELASDELWSSIAFDAIQTYEDQVGNKKLPYGGPRPTRFERVLESIND